MFLRKRNNLFCDKNDYRDKSRKNVLYLYIFEVDFDTEFHLNLQRCRFKLTTAKTSRSTLADVSQLPILSVLLTLASGAVI